MLIKKLMYIFLNFLEKVIPKKNIIIFNSFPDYSDNAYAIFDYLIKNNYEKKYKLIWITNNKIDKELEQRIKKEYEKEITCYYKYSIKGIFNYFLAERIFCTHGIFSKIITKNGKKINLWHGMPLKAIGFLDKKYKDKEKVYNQNYLIATSHFFQKVMAEAFQEEEKNVLLVGQPRNDLFFQRGKFFQKKKLNKEKYKKIIMWMPTYRQSIVGDIRIDGKFNEKYIGILKLDSLKILNEILKEKKFLLLIKIHPMDILNKLKVNSFSNIIILKKNDLENLEEQLYPLLGETDALITDYSSAWLDYEVLEKPIFFMMNDYKEYKNSRGLVFGNFINISSYKIIETEEEFYEFLRKYEEIASIKIDFKVREKYNKYRDNLSCERLIRELKL